MKGALLLIGVLVCASMTDASSVRRQWAKNPLKAIQNRHFKSTVAKVPQPVSDDLGCGDTCDVEFYLAYLSCNPDDYAPDVDAYIGCLAAMFDSDCHDCLCDVINTNTGAPCPDSKSYLKVDRR